MKMTVFNRRVFSRDSLFAMALAMAVLPGLASAQSSEFDPSPIVTKIATYGGMGLLIIGAFLAAIWGLRALGILKHR